MSNESNEVILTDSQSEVIESILPKIRQLEEELQAENPNIDEYLMMINRDLLQYPELTILLTDEQIKPIYSALREKTEVAITVKASKKRGSKGVLDNGKMVGDLL